MMDIAYSLPCARCIFIEILSQSANLSLKFRKKLELKFHKIL